MKKILSFLKFIFSGIRKFSFKKTFVKSVREIMDMTSFFVLLQLYLIKELLLWLSHNSLIRSRLKLLLINISSRIEKLIDKIDKGEPGSISQQEIVRLSLRNMMLKKTRTIITIGGMSIGVGAIVFLVSIGYGLQDLVVSRVARLEEMKQANIVPNVAGKLYLDDATLSKFSEIADVDKTMPLISLVGRVNFKNSITDVVVFGVTKDYLDNSAIKTIRGKVFDSNDVVTKVPLLSEEVAGARVELVEFMNEVRDVNFTFDPESWIRVRSNPSTDSKILGYTRRSEGIQDGVEIWGAGYPDSGSGKAGIDKNGQDLGLWIKAKVPLWEKVTCTTGELGCEEGNYRLIKDSEENQLWEEGYFAEIKLSISDSLTGEVAKEFAGDVLAATDEAEIESDTGLTSEIDTEIKELLESTASATTQKESVSMSDTAIRKTVVNEAMAKVLGVDTNDIVGSKFEASFIVIGGLIPDKENVKVESVPTEYEVVGLVPGTNSPVMYVPFMDLRSMGVSRYSQVKVMTKNPNSLGRVREIISGLGYTSSSVVDTVSQIKSLFTSARFVLALLGTVALAVASLGMFNTLTVSLLERIREVGVMKAMGMKSSEVKSLFLTESMLMGFFGGMVGIGIGSLGGFFLSILLSLFSVFRNYGYLDISSMPVLFTVVIVLLSLIVGFATGLYPAKRATKISALNALRYE